MQKVIIDIHVICNVNLSILIRHLLRTKIVGVKYLGMLPGFIIIFVLSSQIRKVIQVLLDHRM